jgi:hypothetical protein
MDEVTYDPRGNRNHLLMKKRIGGQQLSEQRVDPRAYRPRTRTRAESRLANPSANLCARTRSLTCKKTLSLLSRWLAQVLVGAAGLRGPSMEEPNRSRRSGASKARQGPSA